MSTHQHDGMDFDILALPSRNVLSAREKPKSAMRGVPCRVMKMFSGFKSLCQCAIECEISDVEMNAPMHNSLAVNVPKTLHNLSEDTFKLPWSTF